MSAVRALADPAPVFAALGDRTRLALLRRLSDGQSRSIAGLSADTDLTRQAVTKHLQLLEGVGLVKSQRTGRETRFVFQPQAFEAARTYLETVSAHWDTALERLRALVEDYPSA